MSGVNWTTVWMLTMFQRESHKKLYCIQTELLTSFSIMLKYLFLSVFTIKLLSFAIRSVILNHPVYSFKRAWEVFDFKNEFSITKRTSLSSLLSKLRTNTCWRISSVAQALMITCKFKQFGFIIK